MGITEIVGQIINRFKIDPVGMKNELKADTNFNASFRKRLISIGGGKIL